MTPHTGPHTRDHPPCYLLSFESTMYRIHPHHCSITSFSSRIFLTMFIYSPTSSARSHHFYVLHNLYLLPDFFCALMTFPLGSCNLLSHVYTQAFCSHPSFPLHVFRCVFYSTFFHISTPKGALQIRSVARRKIAGTRIARKVHCKALALEAGPYKKSKRLS